MEIGGTAIATCRDAAEVIEAVEQALNSIPRPIENWRKTVFQTRFALGEMFGTAPLFSICRRTALVL